jgi:ribonucleoside-diphosphate reductase alpha chain
MATKFLSPEAQFRAGVNLRDNQVSGLRNQDSENEASGVSDTGAAAGGSQSAVAGSLQASGPSGSSGPKPAKPAEFAAIQAQEDAPPCSTCGSLMIRSGSCYKCVNCGTTSGCA